MAEVTPTPREGVITRFDAFTDAGVRIEVTPTPREGVITRFTVPRRHRPRTSVGILVARAR